MEKSISLDPKERQVVAQMEQENLKLNARYGQICREKEELDKRLAANEEQQRSFVRDVIFHHGIDQYLSARLADSNTVVCSLQDEPMEQSTSVVPKRTNGGVDIPKAE